MAVQTTEEFKNSGSASYTTAIEKLKDTDLKVRIGGALQDYVASSPGSGEYTVTNNPTTIVLGAIANDVVHIYRETDVDTAAAVFVAGSSIKAADLNAIHDMARFGLSEARSTTIESDIKDGSITSAKIKDGTIVNADVSASAAIDGSKIQASSGSNSGTMSSANFTKLAGIQSGATVDQTGSQIKSLYEGESNTNAFTDAEKTKLSNIPENATDDQTGAEIKTAYEGEANTNAFTDAEKTKLSGIATGAEVNVNADWNSSSGDSEILNKPTLVTSLDGLSDVDTTGVADNKILKYQASSSKFVIADDTGGGGGSSTFTGLSDSPTNYTGSAGKTLKVNSAGDAIEFVDVTTSFVGLTDTPSSLSGQGGKTVKVNSGGTALEFETVATDVIDDTTPQLGGNLDVQSNEITTSTTNGNIKLNPNGTGVVEIKGDGSSADGTLQLNCSQNSHGVKIKSPPHSAGQSYTLTLPSSIQNNGFLKTDSNGILSFASTDVVADTTPQLGGNLDVNDKTIVFDTGITVDLKTGATNAVVNGITQHVQQGSLIIDGGGKDIFFKSTSNGGKITFGSSDGATHEVMRITPSVLGASQHGKVELKYVTANAGGNTSSSTKLATTSTGISVTGTVAADSFTGDGSNLEGVAATVAGGAIYENSQTISASHTIPSGSNGMSAGPVTVNNGVTLTISNGSTYTIV